MSNDKLVQKGFICAVNGPEWEKMYCRRCTNENCSKQQILSEVKSKANMNVIRESK